MKKLITKTLFFYLLLAMNASPLTAEIERVTVTWNAQICLDACVREIARQLQMINGIAEIVISQPQGQADLRWKPKSPFSYDFIKRSVEGAGAGIRDIRLQVRGTLVITPAAVLLESLGDNTRFVLLSPAQQSFYKNVPQINFDTHQLAPEMRQSLVDAATHSEVVVIKGPLLRPNYGLYLIIEQISFNVLSPRQGQQVR